MDYLTLFIQKNGYAPTLREIADGVGLSSLATVHEHISKLEEKGILKRKGKASREIKLIHKNLSIRVYTPQLHFKILHYPSMK